MLIFAGPATGQSGETEAASNPEDGRSPVIAPYRLPEGAKIGERATDGYIDPATEQALWQLIGMRDACAGTDALTDTDLARYERHRMTVANELKGLRELAASAEDSELQLNYARRASVLDRELAMLPESLPMGCLDRAGRNAAVDKAWEFALETYVESIGQPAAGTGFQRDGTAGTVPETYAVQSKDTIDLYGIAANLSYKDIHVWGSYGRGENLTTAAIADGIDSGVVYGELSPGGSSGIAAPFGADARIEEDRLTWAVGFGYQFDFEGGAVDTARPDFSAQPFVQFSRALRELNASVDGAGQRGGFLFEFSQQRDQRIREDRYEAGVTIELSWPVGDRLSFGIDGTAAAYAYKSTLESLDLNRNNFTGPPDESFDIYIRDEESGVGFHGGFGLFAEYDLGGSASFMLRGGFDHRSDVGGVFNPSSGDQVFLEGRRTELIHRSSDAASLTARVSVSW